MPQQPRQSREVVFHYSSTLTEAVPEPLVGGLLAEVRFLPRD